MNDPAAKEEIEPTARPNRAGVLVGLAVVATAIILVVLVVLTTTNREEIVSETAAVAEPSTEQYAAPRRQLRQKLPEESAAVSAPNPAPGSSPARTTAPSGQAPEGIHVFPPLGTRPKLTGVIVPEGFELPPGYVRHYQSTDDGQRLAPILMFDPVNPPLDEFGQPMDIPSDRIVPPEMAPLGMPIDMLELPESPDADSRSLRGLLRSD